MAEPLGRQDLIRLVSRKIDQPYWLGEAAVTAIFTTIEQALSEGRDVRIRGFGTFGRRTVKASQRPFTGVLKDRPDRTYTVEERFAPTFKPSGLLKDALNGVIS